MLPRAFGGVVDQALRVYGVGAAAGRRRERHRDAAGGEYLPDGLCDHGEGMVLVARRKVHQP